MHDVYLRASTPYVYYDYDYLIRMFILLMEMKTMNVCFFSLELDSRNARIDCLLLCCMCKIISSDQNQKQKSNEYCKVNKFSMVIDVLANDLDL